MMLRIVSKQSGNRLAAAMTARQQYIIPPSRFLSTNAAEVFDDEANRQQLEQISKQMEDAVAKEKLIVEIEQATTSQHLWDTNTDAPKSPEDPRIAQAGDPEMMTKIQENQQGDIDRENATNDQSSFSKPEFSTLYNNPSGFEKRQDFTGEKQSEHRNSQEQNRGSRLSGDANSNRSSSIDNPISAAFDAVGNPLSMAVGVVNGTTQILKGTAKVAMRGVRDMADEVLKATGDSTQEQARDRNKNRDREERGKTEESNKSEDQKGGGRTRGSSGGATQAGERDSRAKEYSEHRENASLL